MIYLAAMRYPKLTCLLAVIILPLFCTAQKSVTDSLERVYKQMPDDSTKIKVLYDLIHRLAPSWPDEAWKRTGELERLAISLNYPIGVGMAADIRGNILRAKGKYAEAVEKHYHAIRVYDSLNYTSGYRTALVNLGTDYSYLHNNEKAIEYYRKALQLTDTADHWRQVIILNNIGNIYNQWGKYDSALVVLHRALPHALRDSTNSSQAFLLASMAIVYAQKGDLVNGAAYMLEAIKYQKLAGEKFHYASSSSTLAGFYIELKEYDNARHYLNEAYKAATEIGAKSVIANYYRNKAHLLYKTGDYKNAYDELNRYSALNDSLVNEEHIAQLAESETRYGVEMKNRELELLNADKALKESEILRKTQLQYGLIAILAAMVVALVFAYRNMQLKKKANTALENENALLQKENILAQYETLRNQVNPHFLFNSLNALSSLIKQNPDKAVEFTSVFSRLYRSVLELKDHSVISLAEELKLVDDYIYLQKIRFGDKLILTKDIPATLLGEFIAPFCIQMLIENAIKHNVISDEKSLVIKLYADNNRLIISNNYQPRTQKQESTGTGIKNIIERYKVIHEFIPEFNIIDNEYVAKIPLISAQE